MKRRRLLVLIIMAAGLWLGVKQSIQMASTQTHDYNKLVSMTFDDGPDPRFTPAVLEMLKAHHVKATFFVVGNNVKKYPELTREIINQGHTLANHTFTHPHLELLGKDQVKEEISQGDSILEQTVGSNHMSPYFRPPRGNLSHSITQVISETNKRLTLWSVCMENKSTPTPEQIKERVMTKIRELNGGVILGHDGILDRSLTMKALPLLLDQLAEEGYQIVPLDQYVKVNGKNIKEVIK